MVDRRRQYTQWRDTALPLGRTSPRVAEWMVERLYQATGDAQRDELDVLETTCQADAVVRMWRVR